MSAEHTTEAPSSWRLIRAADRHMWNDEAIDSRQSFPATGSFDLVANAHGMLLVHNDDVVDAGAGFDTHQHHDAEIVTWVVEGSLHHKDSHGSEGVLTPGVVQRMSAGSGIRHSERNASTRSENQRLRVVQMWIAPEYAGGTPHYAEVDVNAALTRGDLVTIVSGLERDIDSPALRIGNSYVALHAARLTPVIRSRFRAHRSATCSSSPEPSRSPGSTSRRRSTSASPSMRAMRYVRSTTPNSR